MSNKEVFKDVKTIFGEESKDLVKDNVYLSAGNRM